MRFKFARIFISALAALPALAICLESVPGRAEVQVQNMQAEGNVPAQSGDPGVARISAAEGRVDVRRSDTGEAYAAVLNAPVGAGDYVTTRAGARAEVEFDYASLLRLAPGTQIRFTQLDPHAHSVQLAQGTVELRVLRGLDAHPEVQTPSALVQPSARGSYRITVTQAGNTEITVRSGRAAVGIDGANGMRDVLPGSTLLVTGDGKHVRAKSIAVVASAAFDRWGDARDARFANVDDWAYVDHGMVGAADLSQYGRWTNSSDYGQVWQPNDVPDGWSPYTDGTWTYQPYYGWTWIGYEPWGYAPYHYGRWFYAGNRWCWYPGPYNAYSPFIYAPALVAFFGFGFGFGNIGWVALAPYEHYHPWWGRGSWHSGGHRFGGRSNGILPRAFRNASAPGGAVAVSGKNFASGRFEHIEPVRGAQLRAAVSFARAQPVAPAAHAFAFGGRDTRAAGVAVSPRFAGFAAPTIRANDVSPHASSGLVRSASAPIERPEMLHAVSAGGGSSVWTRFGGRSTSDDTVARQSPLVVRGDTTGRTGIGVWSRFGSENGSSDRIPSYATERSIEAPERSFNDTNRAYGYARSYAEPVRTYGAPSRGYYESQNSYAIPQRSYAFPQRSYSMPQRSYAMPQRSYAMPQRSYAMPQRSYAMPQRSYAAPNYAASRVSAGSYGGSSGGRRR
jgi:plastocyanin